LIVVADDDHRVGQVSLPVLEEQGAHQGNDRRTGIEWDRSVYGEELAARG
jgi:hypothetical protein